LPQQSSSLAYFIHGQSKAPANSKGVQEDHRNGTSHFQTAHSGTLHPCRRNHSTVLEEISNGSSLSKNSQVTHVDEFFGQQVSSQSGEHSVETWIASPNLPSSFKSMVVVT
jgi:hypothetical protein